VRFVLLLAHVLVGALWLGAMGYSLFVVQPRLAAMLGGRDGDDGRDGDGGDPGRVEEAHRVLAAGNRWRVVALIAVLGLSGLGLALLAPGARPWTWWLLVGAQAVLWAGAAGAFWWVSWRGWPRRVFALPAELPGLQRRFRRVAVALFVLIGSAFVLGVATTASGR
jgi:hypothetical protein